MPKFDEGAASSGAMAGAGLGATVGGPYGALGGFLIGGGLGGFFGGSKRKSIDISAEIAKIKALYAENREAAIAAINREATQGRQAAASNLAARGTYRSPASQGTFNLLEDARLAAIGQASGRIAGEQAGVQAQLLQYLTGQKIEEQNFKEQKRAALFGALSGLGTNLLIGGLQQRPGTQPQRPHSTQFFQPGSYPYGPDSYRNPGAFNLNWDPNAYRNNALLLRAWGGR